MTNQPKQPTKEAEDKKPEVADAKEEVKKPTKEAEDKKEETDPSPKKKVEFPTFDDTEEEFSSKPATERVYGIDAKVKKAIAKRDLHDPASIISFFGLTLDECTEENRKNLLAMGLSEKEIDLVIPEQKKAEKVVLESIPTYDIPTHIRKIMNYYGLSSQDFNDRNALKKKVAVKGVEHKEPYDAVCAFVTKYVASKAKTESEKIK